MVFDLELKFISFHLLHVMIYFHIRNYHTDNVNVVWHVYCSGVNNFSTAFNYFKITVATAMKLKAEEAKCS